MYIQLDEIKLQIKMKSGQIKGKRSDQGIIGPSSGRQSQEVISNDVLQLCIQEFYTQCHHNEGCIKTVMLRGDIYSIPGFYHITNGNHPVINTKHKRDFIS